MADPSQVKAPVLDLQTLIERPIIAIDGVDYEILSPEELSAVDHQRMNSAGRTFDRLMSKPKLTKGEKVQIARELHSLSDRIMVGVPEEVRARMNDTQRMAVVEAFTELPLLKTMAALAPAAGANRKARRANAKKSTGAKKRRGSKGSSEATLRGGSTKRPSPSSAHT